MAKNKESVPNSDNAPATAAGQALGYSLQYTRLTAILFEAPPGTECSLEVIDDVAAEDQGGQQHLVQSKSALGSNPVSDRAISLWKTIYNWVELVQHGFISCDKPIFELYVSRPASGPIIKAFHEARTLQAAKEALTFARQSLWGDPPGCAKKMTLTSDVGRYANAVLEADVAIVAKIVVGLRLVCGSGSPQADVEAIIRRHPVDSEKVKTIADHLCGWVKRRVDEKLELSQPAFIARNDFHLAYLAICRRLDRQRILVSATGLPSLDERLERLPDIFVQQLELIDIPYEEKLEAVSDFLRASSDRTLWAVSGDVDETSFEELDEKLTRKSAVIPIIDYCLGANVCTIPVQTIRHACEWFGVIVSTSSGEILLARKEPGAQRSTDEMFIFEAPHIDEVPPRLIKNTTADKVRRFLDELAGLSNLDFSAATGKTGFDQRASFRDLMAFIFQPQNVIANPDVFFFKTNTYEHREKLRKIFPYILGAVTPSLLAKQHELRRIQLELRRKTRELKDAEEVSLRWLAELQSKISEARELGLLPSDVGDGLSRAEMIELLQGIVRRTDITIAVTGSTISDAVRELSKLEAEESDVSQTLTRARRRFSEMNRIRESSCQYHDALRVQRDRLQITDWLVRNREGDEECPICGSGMQATHENLDRLRLGLKDLEERTSATLEVPAAFEREMQRVSGEITDLAEKLKAVQLRKQSLTSQSAAARDRQFQARRAERFVGNLENALELHRRLGKADGLRQEVEELQIQERKLAAELRLQDIESRKRRALKHVNGYAQRLLPLLDAERPNDPVSLEINDLTIRSLELIETISFLK